MSRTVAAKKISIWLPVICMMLLQLGAVAASQAQTLTEITSFGDNPGNLRMRVYLPVTLHEHAPLVVVAHGCFQTVDLLVEHAGWTELADRHGFALLFPETNRENEPFGGCFRTWVPEHQRRGAGEPLSIRNQVAWMLEEYDLEPERVFMVGQSSGGLVTSVMLASYPEMFAAGAAQSAYPYRCAEDFEQLAACSQAQVELAPAAWSDRIRAAAADYDGPRPRVALWHGAVDALIVPANLELQLQQWAGVLGVDTERYLEDRIDGQLRRRYQEPGGDTVIETVLVSGMDHAIAIDPDGQPPCGSPAPYIVDADICAARWIGRWFGVVPEADLP